MADDLVAELTLTLRNEMNAGLDEVRAEFGTLDTTLQGLREVLGSLTEELAAMRAPAGLVSGFADVDAEIKNVIGSVEDIGAAIDADITKVHDMQAAMVAMYETQADMATGGGGAGGGGGNAGGGGGSPKDEGRGYVSSATHGGASLANDAFFGLIGLDAAHHFAKAFADYDWTLTHIAITEKLSGSAAQDEVSRISAFLNALALNTGTSSTDLANAYSFLITTGMKRSEIDQIVPDLAYASTAYNTPVSQMDQSAFTLSENFKVPEDEMETGLARLAYAAKLGHYTFADFSAGLGDVGGQASLAGMTGLQGEDVVASTLEVIRRNEGNSPQANTDLKDFLVYMHSPMALRMFDKTTRMEDLLGASGRELLDKYHIKPLDLPEYLNDETAKGIDPINAMADYFHNLLAPIASPTDRGTIVGSFLHNQAAQNAILAMTQYYNDSPDGLPGFKSLQSTLGAVDPNTVRVDYQTASAAPETMMKKNDELWAQLEREIGNDLIPLFHGLGIEVKGFTVVLEAVTGLMSDYVLKPLGVGLGTTAAYTQHEIDTHPNGAIRSRFGYGAPMELHIKVSPDGTPTSTSVTKAAPGVNVKVNQGQVLGAH